MKRNRMMLPLIGAAALLVTGLLAAVPAQADTFLLTSCHISGSSCDGQSVPNSSAFGTVTLTQSGTSVVFDVVLNNGNRFVETGASNFEFFVFNDALATSTITNATATLNGNTVTNLTIIGSTNLSEFLADGTGHFTASVECDPTNSNCKTGGAIETINDLHFTVTNATIAQLAVGNDLGNLFVADILCGTAQTQCAGKTGDVDVNTSNVPDGGVTVMLLGGALVGLETLRRKFRV